MRGLISTLLHWLGRLVKALIGLLLIPPVIGLVLGIRQQLDAWLVGQRSFTEWIMVGSVSYLGVHLLVYKPRALFRIQHGLLSRLSVWLFGGQVAMVAPKGEKPKSEKKAEKDKNQSGSSQGSTLLVLSPYLVPLYTLLVCLASWLLKRWLSPALVDPSAGFLIGASLTLHWVMAADDLQQNRGRFPPDAYLLALALIGLVSLLVVSLCLPMAVPGFSLPSVFAEALLHARAIYAAVFGALFV